MTTDKRDMYVHFYFFNRWKAISMTIEKSCWKVWERSSTPHLSSPMLPCSNRPWYSDCKYCCHLFNLEIQRQNFGGKEWLQIIPFLRNFDTTKPYCISFEIDLIESNWFLRNIFQIQQLIKAALRTDFIYLPLTFTADSTTYVNICSKSIGLPH